MRSDAYRCVHIADISTSVTNLAALAYYLPKPFTIKMLHRRQFCMRHRLLPRPNLAEATEAEVRLNQSCVRKSLLIVRYV
jgi:hypothetical protein